MSAVPPIKSSVIEKSTTLPLKENKMIIDQFLKMSPNQYEQLTGVNLSFKEKLVFSMLKKELKKKNINSTIDLEAAMAESSNDFSWAGFFAGFFLGLIGVAFVHLLSHDKEMRRAAWFGCGVYFILVLLYVALLSSIFKSVY
jgi:hypothetical protein